VVSATRTPQDAQFTTSSVDVVPLLKLDLAQVDDLRTALSAVPGVNIVNTGAPGGQTSVFIRGSSSTQTLFVVDGIPMNSRAAGYNNFLGAADITGIDRIEVLRGPQSTLYGSSAMGGVIFIDSTRGCGAPTGNVSTTFGSFDTWGASAAVSGGTSTVGYSASLARYSTDNVHDNNAFDSWSYSTRIEGTPTSTLLVGATFRGQQNDSEQLRLRQRRCRRRQPPHDRLRPVERGQGVFLPPDRRTAPASLLLRRRRLSLRHPRSAQRGRLAEQLVRLPRCGDRRRRHLRA
jgi:vitamin B12 transporter